MVGNYKPGCGAGRIGTADVYKRQRYTCTYGCPVNADGQGICSKTMLMMFPAMEAVRSGGDLENVGGDGRYSKTIVCPDGNVIFKMTAKKRHNGNFYKDKSFD